jgi:hypothetical protein
MDRLLTLWPLYAPAAAIVGLGVAMRTLWGVYLSRVAIWTGCIIFVVMGVAWELSTDSPLWLRVLNGVFAAIVVSVVFSKILGWGDRGNGNQHK